MPLKCGLILKCGVLAGMFEFRISLSRGSSHDNQHKRSVLPRIAERLLRPRGKEKPEASRKRSVNLEKIIGEGHLSTRIDWLQKWAWLIENSLGHTPVTARKLWGSSYCWYKSIVFTRHL